MTKDNVQRAIGSPTTVRGALQNKYGQTVEVWEYRLQSMNSAGMILQATATAMAAERPGGTPLPVDYGYTRCWLYFVNDRLVQWGQVGDWAKEADRIYEVRFGSNAELTTPQ